MVLQPQHHKYMKVRKLHTEKCTYWFLLLTYRLCNTVFFLTGYSHKMRQHPPLPVQHRTASQSFTTCICNGFLRTMLLFTKKTPKNKNHLNQQTIQPNKSKQTPFLQISIWLLKAHTSLPPTPTPQKKSVRKHSFTMHPKLRRNSRAD